MFSLVLIGWVVFGRFLGGLGFGGFFGKIVFVGFYYRVVERREVRLGFLGWYVWLCFDLVGWFFKLDVVMFRVVCSCVLRDY